MRMSMAAVCGALLYRSVKHVRFDDLMTIPERQAALAAFHDDAPFLVMSTRTKGIGLNLQIATTVAESARYVHALFGLLVGLCGTSLPATREASDVVGQSMGSVGLVASLISVGHLVVRAQSRWRLR